jgi:hypothetical protein
MCPVCLMSVAAMAAGVTSSGGLTALVVRSFWSGNIKGSFIHENEKKRRRDNGNFSYEHEAKSESDVAGAVARGTQGAVEEGEGIHEDA